jgi:hypothetical protein
MNTISNSNLHPSSVTSNMGVMTGCESRKGFSLISNFVNWLPSTSILMLLPIPPFLLFITTRCHFWVFCSASWYVHNLLSSSSSCQEKWVGLEGFVGVSKVIVQVYLYRIVVEAGRIVKDVY